MPAIKVRNKIPLKKEYMIFINQYQIKEPIPTDGLIGEWLFSGNANDSSGGGNHGTVSGATAALAIDRKGNANSCYYLPAGDDGIIIGDYLDMGTSDMSISAWFKTIINSSPGYGFIVSKCYTTGGNGTWFIGVGYSTYEKIRPAFIGNNGVVISQYGTTEITNVWIHVVVNYDRNGNMDTYLDTVLDSSVSISERSADDMQTSRRLVLGALDAGATISTSIHGYIDDVRIYNRLLTTHEIEILYNE